MSEPSSQSGVDVLAFAPHPDDAELCCGATLAKLAARGYRVGVVDLTRGELASNGTPETRAREAAAASEALGLAHRENLGLPDGFLDPTGGYDEAAQRAGRGSQLARVVEVIRRLRPELVLAPWRAARHPDHEAASELVTRACFFSGVRRFETEPESERHVPGRLIYYMMRFAFEPSFVVDTTGEPSAAKARAIACYGSQVQRDAGAAMAPTLANAPLNLAALDARDRYYGAMIGVEQGEPFALSGPLAVDDPLAHFRAHPSAPLLFLEKR